MTKKTATPVKPTSDAHRDNLREELRVLQSADNTNPEGNWVTPEFISMVSTVAVNLVTAATIIGWVDVNSAQELTRALTTIATAAGTISVNGLIVWKYLAGREAVKKEAIRAKYQYMESVAVERLRANSGW
jgi:hypothetical protein